jgi:hypothetical protein
MSSGVVAVHHRSAGARTMNNSGRVSSRILASLPLRSWLLSWWTELVGSSQRLVARPRQDFEAVGRRVPCRVHTVSTPR